MAQAKNPCPSCRNQRQALEARCDHCGWSPDSPLSATDPANAPPDKLSDEQQMEREGYIDWVWGVVGAVGVAVIAYLTGNTDKLRNEMFDIGVILLLAGLFLAFVFILWILKILTQR